MSSVSISIRVGARAGVGAAFGGLANAGDASSSRASRALMPLKCRDREEPSSLHSFVRASGFVRGGAGCGSPPVGENVHVAVIVDGPRPAGNLHARIRFSMHAMAALLSSDAS